MRAGPVISEASVIHLIHCFANLHGGEVIRLGPPMSVGFVKRQNGVAGGEDVLTREQNFGCWTKFEHLAQEGELAASANDGEYFAKVD